jgi:hypothetical protein
MQRLFGRRRRENPSGWRDSDELATWVHERNYCIEVPKASTTTNEEEDEQEPLCPALSTAENFLRRVDTGNLRQAAAQCLDQDVHMDHALLGVGKVHVTSRSAWVQASVKDAYVPYYKGIRWQGLASGVHEAQVVRWGYHGRIGSVLEVFHVENNRIVQCHLRKGLGKLTLVDCWAKSSRCRETLDDSASDLDFDVELLVGHVEERLRACNMWA